MTGPRTSVLHDRRARVSAISILVGIVLLLLPALAWMQYQWLGQLSEAERERMQRTLRTAAAQFANDFDSELSRTLISLQVNGATLRDQNWRAYAQNYSQWAASTTDPRLVRDVWLVDTLPGTALPQIGGDGRVPPDRLRIRRWNTPSMVFEDAAWPDDLAHWRETLGTRFIGLQMQRPRGGDNVHRDATLSLTLGDDVTLISPVTYIEFPDDHRGPPKIAILGFTIVRLDPAVIRETLLASLAGKHFNSAGGETNYRVAVIRKDDASSVVWESEPGAARLVAVNPDVAQSFMGPRPDQMVVFARGMRGANPGTGNREPGTVSRAESRIPDPGSPIPTEESKVVISMVEREERMNGGRMVTRAGTFGAEGRWMLFAQHRAGSLEAAVAAVRLRNLWVSSGVLLLLTLAIGLIVVSARRAQSLARQQMEFVAAVSHELRTPVSVIGAAAGNLADGVVGDPQRVRKYGETIQGEARRLAETVERVLQLAGIAAGRAAASQTLVDPAALVREAIAECRTEIDAAGVTIETSIADGLPPVNGDVAALRSALRNLISNGIKYGGHARWLRVSARVGNREPGSGIRKTSGMPVPGSRLPAPDSVVFTVEDRGPGIDPEDRKHIFEPFYRGREAVSQQIQGSGLGLNLVLRIAEAHGGGVSVTSEPGKGSTFTMSLPAAADRPATESESLNLVREAPSPR
jgi:signal transduction histidine kinase